MRGQARGAEFWAGMVSEWRQSGEPLGRFARRHGVAPNSLAYWVDKTVPRVLPVTVVDGRGAPAMVELSVRGAVLRLHRSPELTLVRSTDLTREGGRCSRRGRRSAWAAGDMGAWSPRASGAVSAGGGTGLR